MGVQVPPPAPNFFVAVASTNEAGPDGVLEREGLRFTMQVTENNAEGLKRDFTVVVPAADIETKITDRLKEVSKTIRMPGFRPGKVPVSLLRKQYGSSVMGEVLEAVINESSQKVVEEREFRPAMQPKIEITKFEEGADLEFSLGIELFPEFEPADFSKLKLEKMVVDISDNDLQESLERLAGAYKTSEPITSTRKSKKGDVAVINFVGKVDGEEFQGGKADDYPLELGSGSFIPGFEDQVVGAKVGDKLDVKVKFPEDYGAENLAGKDAVFEVEVKELRESKPAAIDDDLAKKMGMEDLGKLKDALKEEQGREFESIARMRMKRVLFDLLLESHNFELPEGMVEQEFDSIWKQFEETRKNNPDAIDEDDKDKSDDELKEEYTALAQRRVRLGLLLAEVGRLNNIEVNQDELNRAVMEEARKYPGQEQQFFEFYQKNPDAVQAFQGPIFEDKVVDYIIELAKVSEKKVSVDELMKEPEVDPSQSTKTTKKAAAKKKAPAKKKAAAKKAPAKKAAEKSE